MLLFAWGVLAREYNTGRKNITTWEGALFFGALSIATVKALEVLT